MHEGDVCHLKLDRELDIRNFIASVAHVDDYKTILKSVKTLSDKEKNARAEGVDIDAGLMGDINRCN